MVWTFIYFYNFFFLQKNPVGFIQDILPAASPDGFQPSLEAGEGRRSAPLPLVLPGLTRLCPLTRGALRSEGRHPAGADWWERGKEARGDWLDALFLPSDWLRGESGCSVCLFVLRGAA